MSSWCFDLSDGLLLKNESAVKFASFFYTLCSLKIPPGFMSYRTKYGICDKNSGKKRRGK